MQSGISGSIGVYRGLSGLNTILTLFGVNGETCYFCVVMWHVHPDRMSVTDICHNNMYLKTHGEMRGSV